MAQAFVDEEQIEIGARIQAVAVAAACDQGTGGGRNVLKAHIRRIADDGVELLVFGVGEEVDRLRTWRTVIGVELQAHCAGQVAEKGTIAARWLEHAPRVAAQGQHGAHDRLGREHLAQCGNIAQTEAQLFRHAGLWRRKGREGKGSDRGRKT